MLVIQQQKLHQLLFHNHDKYIATPKFNALAADVFKSRLPQENLVTKTNFDNTVSSLDSKIAKNQTKNKSIENEFKKLKTFLLGYFIGKSYFQEEDGVQNYLVFQPIKRYFQIISNTKQISSWKTKRISDKTITPNAISDNSLAQLIDYCGRKVRVKFNKGCLNQPNNLTYGYGSRVNIFVAYELGASSSNDSDPTLKNCLFGAVTLTKKRRY